jgi:hypothetical protein
MKMHKVTHWKLRALVSKTLYIKQNKVAYLATYENIKNKKLNSFPMLSANVACGSLKWLSCVEMVEISTLKRD